MNNHISVLEIDGNALFHNLAFFKQKLHPATQVLAVVKAFGYGSSGVEVAKTLQDNVSYFGVAYTQEGEALRSAGIENSVLVLHPQIQNFDALVEACLMPSMYNFKTLNAFISCIEAKGLTEYPIHLKFNTGLNRLGFLPSDIPAILEVLNTTKAIKVEGVFSHLAASEDLNEREFTQQQITDFETIRQTISSTLPYTPIYHLLNTSGVVNYATHQYDMVRIGVGLYGFGNEDHITQQLKNTHCLRSVISQIHTIEPGASVGYNRGYIASDITKTATIPIGHADGISRRLGKGKGYVYIHQQKAPIIGNVCMDMLMVDITHINCNEGDIVWLFKHQDDILHMAALADTISYEIITSISQRIKRVVKV